jgi:hypothetical protein
MIQPNSRIFITFYGNVDGGWWISERTDGRFEISLQNLAGTDIPFEYLIVNVVDSRTPPEPVDEEDGDGSLDDSSTAPTEPASTEPDPADSGDPAPTEPDPADSGDPAPTEPDPVPPETPDAGGSLDDASTAPTEPAP